MDAFDSADDERPTLFIAYTVKGYGLPLAGHKDNHSGMMNPGQIDQLRMAMGIEAGEEWEPFAGLGGNMAARLKNFIGDSVLAAKPEEPVAPQIHVPARFAVPSGDVQSTQAAFGNVLLDLAKSSEELADRIVTTAPDVTQTTNLGGFVNQRGLFRRSDVADIFREAKIPSAQKWAAHAAGQHIELGIAENNFFLLLTSLGLAAPHFGTRLIPVGTVYDPFIARGLDALNYGCYSDSRFLLVGTPSGLTLGPEGGAHQSINTPLIGMGQPGLAYFEPAYADEVALFMRWAFEYLQKPEGSSVYLRLSTRQVAQVERANTDWEADALKGGYWLRPPMAGAEAAIAFTGAIAPEVLAAYEQMLDDIPGLGVLNVTSPDVLHREWSASKAARWTDRNAQTCHAEDLLSILAPDAGIVTVIDGSPGALSWLGGVHGMRVSPLGTDRFGQTGDLPDLYSEYRLDSAAIIDAMAELFLKR
jgi:pyruvate dehydrogenase E1 component